MITYRIDDANFHRDFARLIDAAKRPRALLVAAGRAAYNQLRKHFRGKDKTPNALGGERSHFWLQVMRSTQAPLPDEDARTVTISITDPRIAQKVYGGTITAKRAKALTIPVSPEAYGRTAAVLEQELNVKLFVLPSQFGGGLLAQALSDNSIQIHYVLRPSVDQDPDPTALPEMTPGSPFMADVLNQARLALNRQLPGPSPA